MTRAQECVGRLRRAVQREDANQRTIWRGFEKVLVEYSPGVKTLYTTWEDLYERPGWQRFLEQQGYKKADKTAFLKAVGDESD